MRISMLLCISTLVLLGATASFAGVAQADPIVDCVVNYYVHHGTCGYGGNCYTSNGRLICHFGSNYYEFPVLP